MAREGRKLPEIEIKNMIEEADFDGNAQINFDEFYKLINIDID